MWAPLTNEMLPCSSGIFMVGGTVLGIGTSWYLYQVLAAFLPSPSMHESKKADLLLCS